MRLLLDADVLIGALDRSDAHHDPARALFVHAREHQDSLSISLVNLTEVLIAPAADSAKLVAAREAITALGLSIHQPSEAIAVDAAKLRARHPISLPDAYLLASAKHLGATIVTFDRKVHHAAQREGLTPLDR